MGRIDLSRAFDDVPRIAIDESKILGATGEVYALDGTIADSAQPFRVTLAWTDAPGPTTGNAYVNNLDLRVTVNGTTYRGNVFATEFSKSGGTADARNNVESVFLPIGTTGPFSISVRAANLAGDGVPGNADLTDQDFALFVYNGTSGALHPDFSVVASPAAESVTVGSSTTFAVSAGALYGFAGTVSLTASPAISGVTYAWNPASVAAGGTATLTVSASATAPLGPHTITLTGTSGGVSHATTVDLSIVPVLAPNAVHTYSAAPHVAIPDDDGTGVTSKIDVPDDIKIASIAVTPSITHTYQGDLNVTLIGPDGTSVPLHDQTGGAADDVKTTYAIATPSVLPLTAYVGHTTKGKWSLKVKDLAAGDVGTLDNWSITFNGEKSATVGLDIPDNSAIGVTSKLNFAQLGSVATARVRVKILHPHIGDLVVKLTAPDGTAVTLHNKSGGAGDDIDTEYPDLTASAQSLSALVGKPIQGDWKLTVQDLVGTNLGVLSNWTLSLTTP
jgi:subtilisin-like proprotein convertase family protein